MKICLSCAKPFEAPDWKCPRCNWQPRNRNGVTYFADHINVADDGFDPAWYAELAALEEGNFWFQARNRLINWIAQHRLPADGSYLELGCGTGFVLQMLTHRFPGWKVSATEAHHEGIAFARQRVGPTVRFYQMDARHIPFRSEFDIVGAFDVIEHIREDEDVLREINAALRPGGIFLFSVPQHMFLWSRFDEANCHFRRYSMRELRHKLDSTRFEIIDSTSFNALLLPLMFLSRLSIRNKKNGKIDILDDLKQSRIGNRLLSIVLSLEFEIFRLGIRWPVGGSRIVVARKT